MIVATSVIVGIGSAVAIAIGSLFITSILRQINRALPKIAIRMGRRLTDDAKARFSDDVQSWEYDAREEAATVATGGLQTELYVLRRLITLPVHAYALSRHAEQHARAGEALAISSSPELSVTVRDIGERVVVFGQEETFGVSFNHGLRTERQWSSIRDKIIWFVENRYPGHAAATQVALYAYQDVRQKLMQPARLRGARDWGEGENASN